VLEGDALSLLGTVSISLKEGVMLNRRGPRIGTLAIGAVVAATLTLAGCGSNSPSGPTPGGASAAPITVVASTNVWGDITKQIGGDHVDVTSILSDPNADPHAYESDAKTAAAVSKAGLVVENGLGYDSFMDRLLAASPKPNRPVLNVADAMKISGPDANPHIWYDIPKIPDAATAIADQLGRIDPADAGTFTANARAFTDSLAPVTGAIDNIKAKYPGAPVGYTERVPGYLVEAAGLTLVTPESFARSIEDGNDPSVADSQAMDAALTSKAVRVLLYNAQVTSPATDAVKQLAQSSGVPVVGVTETLPPTDKSFQAWQLRQINEITTALGG
jgi:zinc/manganese transport system substrate-binding protein